VFKLRGYLERYAELNLEVFVVVNHDYHHKYKSIMDEFPFKTKFIDPSTQEGQDFTREMIDLNEKAYGANFGTIGAGITAGFLSNNKPISKLSLVGNISEPNIAHQWTLLVDPDFEGLGIGSISFALALHLAQEKDFLTFIIQTDNLSSNIYLKNIYQLDIMSYGFVHSCENSMLIKTKIPKENIFKTIVDNKIPNLKFEDFETVTHEIPLTNISFWVREDNHMLLKKLNELINAGHKFVFKGKCKNDNTAFLLIERSKNL
jgi:ribosomal protein S18 acetylase RimI-like enzyme